MEEGSHPSGFTGDFLLPGDQTCSHYYTLVIVEKFCNLLRIEWETDETFEEGEAQWTEANKFQRPTQN